VNDAHPQDDSFLVSLRSYFERLLVEQDRVRLAELTGLRTELVARLDASDKALILQLGAAEKALTLKSGEIERRLEMLNGEASRLAVVLAQSVPREVWEESQKAQDHWNAGVDRALNLAAGKSAQTIYIVGLVLVALQIALKFFVH